MNRSHDRAAGFSSQGRRSENEDAYALIALGGGAFAAAVADGMGGHSHGKAASEAAVTAFRTALNSATSGGRDELEQAFAAAVDAVVAKTRDLSSEDTGTTLIGVIVDPSGTGWIAHAGDSAAVLVTRSEVRRLTVDHSFVAEQMKLGRMTELESYSHPLRNAITRALGSIPVTPEWTEVRIAEPAVLILATDGVVKFVGDSDIAAIGETAAGADDAVRRLVLQAIRNGGDDNATAVAVALGGWRWKKPKTRRLRLAAVLMIAAIALAVSIFVIYRKPLMDMRRMLRPAAPAKHHRPSPPAAPRKR